MLKALVMIHYDRVKAKCYDQTVFKQVRIMFRVERMIKVIVIDCQNTLRF